MSLLIHPEKVKIGKEWTLCGTRIPDAGKQVEVIKKGVGPVLIAHGSLVHQRWTFHTGNVVSSLDTYMEMTDLWRYK